MDGIPWRVDKRSWDTIGFREAQPIGTSLRVKIGVVVSGRRGDQKYDDPAAAIKIYLICTSCGDEWRRRSGPYGTRHRPVAAKTPPGCLALSPDPLPLTRYDPIFSVNVTKNTMIPPRQ